MEAKHVYTHLQGQQGDHPSENMRGREKEKGGEILKPCINSVTYYVFCKAIHSSIG